MKTKTVILDAINHLTALIYIYNYILSSHHIYCLFSFRFLIFRSMWWHINMLRQYIYICVCVINYTSSCIIAHYLCVAFIAWQGSWLRYFLKGETKCQCWNVMAPVLTDCDDSHRRTACRHYTHLSWPYHRPGHIYLHHSPPAVHVNALENLFVFILDSILFYLFELRIRKLFSILSLT